MSIIKGLLLSGLKIQPKLPFRHKVYETVVLLTDEGTAGVAAVTSRVVRIILSLLLVMVVQDRAGIE